MARKEPRKRTPDERAADEARYQDQMRRLEEMIERYRKLNAERRARRPSRSSFAAAGARLSNAAMKKRRKMTREEREAKRLRHEDLTRRLEETIERYRKLNAERRAAEG
jgi:glucuronate isomerase